MSQEDRSEALIEVLDALEQSDIGFVLVGGYAISQFEPRFSTDLDLVIAPDDYDEVVTFLETHDFERKADLEVPPEETIYNREIELFERTEGLPHPVGVDILVNGLGCRQTEAEWSFDYLRTHSSPTTISGGTRSTTARAADGEVLVAVKLHSGRKTDLADVLAAVPAIELDEVETHLHRGDAAALRGQLNDAQAFIEEGGLDHRFKSMFGQSSASAEDIETLLEFLKRQQQ
ncbi:nucleotidyltransferase family protein [Haloarcula nitratireducens]|uniref:Nucleotidyltransferase family protein n=1 Tax=Haloarcula nitratireducens TaxID=2487749 RepID=A0AAW4PJT6_9EURY|nr:nucleotidyltransferase family protein [Halomicroarcula nitratireducens]MBX0298238.1 nucleotidyltransferase family protein [Halomicroarcula nitratireducens]